MPPKEGCIWNWPPDLNVHGTKPATVSWGLRCFHRVNGTQRPGPSALPWNLKPKAYLAKKFMKPSERSSGSREHTSFLSWLSQPSPAWPGPAHSGSLAITIPQSWWPCPSLSQISCPPPGPSFYLSASFPFPLLSLTAMMACRLSPTFCGP